VPWPLAPGIFGRLPGWLEADFCALEVSLEGKACFESFSFLLLIFVFVKNYIVKDAKWADVQVDSGAGQGLVLRSKFYRKYIWNDFNVDHADLIRRSEIKGSKSGGQLALLRSFYLPSSMLSQGFQVSAQACVYQALYVI